MSLTSTQLTNLARMWLSEQSPISEATVDAVLVAARDRALEFGTPLLDSLLVEVISELAEQYRPSWAACVRVMHPQSNVDDVIHDFIVRVIGRIRTFAACVEADLEARELTSDAETAARPATSPPPLHVWLTGQLIDTRSNNSAKDRVRRRHVVERSDVGLGRADDGTGLSTRIDRNNRRLQVELTLTSVGRQDPRAERILRALYLEGMTRPDLAAELGVTLNHLDVLAHRARILFRQAWLELGFGPPSGDVA